MLQKITIQLSSIFLNRVVKADIYSTLEKNEMVSSDLLLINDGQDLHAMQFEKILENKMSQGRSLVCVGIHAGEERKQEYGVMGTPDYMGRGSKAGAYASFMLKELIPFVQRETGLRSFQQQFLCGFSLGGLMAFDLMMEYPQMFQACGVFSGSFWWRSKSLEDGYVEERDRIMHAKIRTKTMTKGQRFFLQTGQLDEKEDRNRNGIIDSIDDTLGIIVELKKLGYEDKKNIHYLELPDGSHDVNTWARVMPLFLDWLKQS